VNGRARRIPRYITTHYEGRGTRFLVFPQNRDIAAFHMPQTVHLSARPGVIGAGPRDARMYVVDAMGKRPYYWKGVQRAEPPYRCRRSGRVARPRGGHFDHIRPRPATAHEFSAAMLYAVVNVTLEVWETYLRQPIRWYFARRFRRLELIPRIVSGTAYSRPGYLECGSRRVRGQTQWLCENFDVPSHETGHMILRWVIGHPPQPQPVEWRAREEAFADVVAMVTLLHFPRVIEVLLRQTRGNLFSDNLLSNLGDLGRGRTMRHAFNTTTMADVVWQPDQDAFKYDLAAPLTAAAFDILVDMYEDALIAHRAIPSALARFSTDPRRRRQHNLQRLFDAAYAERGPRFEPALLEARDRFARLMARLWRKLSYDALYPAVAQTLVDAAGRMDGPRLARQVRTALVGRGIVPAPAR